MYCRFHSFASGVYVQIEIVLAKSDKFDSLMTPAPEEEAVANMGEKPIETEAREGKKEWPPKQISRISIIFFITITRKLFVRRHIKKNAFLLTQKWNFMERQWNVMLIIFQILICEVNLALVDRWILLYFVNIQSLLVHSLLLINYFIFFI